MPATGDLGMVSRASCHCFLFSSRRRHTRYWRDWSSDVCCSDLAAAAAGGRGLGAGRGRGPHGGDRRGTAGGAGAGPDARGVRVGGDRRPARRGRGARSVSDVLSLFVLVALLLGNAFFVAAEFALVTARPDQLEPRAAAGSARARTTIRAMRNVSAMMAGAQLGITLCSLGLGAVGEPAVAHLIEAPMAAVGVPEELLHPIALVIALSIVTVLHMVLGEMVPKNITIAGPDRAALVLGPPLAAFVRLLGPVIRLFNAMANALVRAVGVQPTDEVAASFDEAEIRSMIHQSRQEGRLGSEVGELAAGALTFDRDELDSVLLPLDRLVTVPRSTTPRRIEAVVAGDRLSPYPVRDDHGGLRRHRHGKGRLGGGAEGRG